MGLRREMKNGINLFFAKDVRDQVGRCNITLDKLEVWLFKELLQVGQAGAVIKLVVDDDLVLRVLVTEQDCYMTPNEAWKERERKRVWYCVRKRQRRPQPISHFQ